MQEHLLFLWAIGTCKSDRLLVDVDVSIEEYVNVEAIGGASKFTWLVFDGLLDNSELAFSKNQ